MNPGKRAIIAVFIYSLLFFPVFGSITDRSIERPVDWGAMEQEALDLFISYLKIETTNPPGNEIRAASFFAEICRREGIEHKVFEPFPGRGTIWARLKGNGSRRPLILLNHTDVVPHNPEFWKFDAFSGTIDNGFVYGRGALDMKSLGMAQFMTLLALKRSNVRLDRDVIFLATADEEAGGLKGAGWFAQNQKELIEGAEFLLNEGGNNLVDSSGRVLAIGVGPAEKTPVWLRLTASGDAGHASIPRPNSAVNRLLRALNRLLDYTSPIRLTPEVEQAFRAMAPLLPAGQSEKYLNLGQSIKDPEFLRQLESEPGARSLIRNTISITVLGGSNKINIIPPIATAEVDTRIVPGESISRWIEELKSVIKDDSIRIETILAFEANASPIDSDLVKTISGMVRKRYPEAIISHPVLAGFTDSHYYRKLGVKSYGFSPFVAPPAELGEGYHGNNERIGKKAFLDGIRFYYEVVEQLVK